MNHKNRKILVLVVLIVICIAASALFVVDASKRGPLFGYFVHSWRSLKKLPNIAHFPYWFQKSDLPTYHIIISRSNVEELNSSLPIDASSLKYGTLDEDSKHYVNAYFVSQNYQSEIKIRYRGLMPNNWHAEKKAYRIKFPKDNLFNGMRALNLFIPNDRGYFLGALNTYRAQKLGLLATDVKFVRVYINNRDAGVYLASEPWSKELLSRNNIIDTNNILSNSDDYIEPDKPLFFDWKSYTAENEDGPFEELEALKRITQASDEEFYRRIGDLIDLDKLYRWQVLSVLAGSNHQSDSTNFVLLFKQETGKFEPLPWNVEFHQLDENIYANIPTLAHRVLENEIFYKQYTTLLKEYIENESNLKDDLAYYDDLVRQLREEFYRDQAKNENNFTVNIMINDDRDDIIRNFETAKSIAKIEILPEREIQKSYGQIQFEESFQYFNKISRGIDNFLLEYPQFSKIDNTTLVLKSGAHIFTQTVIVPKNLRLIIEPGAQLLFYPGISFVSYSPISAVGNADQPIYLGPSYPGFAESWGSFAIVNTGLKENIFEYINVKGGSSDTINGISLTSQFSLHNAKSKIENSIFEGGKSDDGLHVILGSVEIYKSVFRNNYADSLDLDYLTDAHIEWNTFWNFQPEDSNGDAIDLSGMLNVVIKNNVIVNHGDKGISVGENSAPLIDGNYIFGCNIGIAVKDLSQATLKNNYILKNKTSGVSLYNKKPEFVNGGYAKISDSIIWDNGQEITKDHLSSMEIKDSTIENGYTDGTNINESEPDLRSFLPAWIYSLYEKL